MKSMVRIALAALLVLLLCGSGVSGNRPNIVLISFDTLRVDHVGAYGYRGSATPFMDGVAARGALFRNDLTPFVSTTPAHAAMFTSLHPFKTGAVNLAIPISPDVETIAEVLQRNGYATAGATSVFHLGRSYNFGQGFERFSDVGGNQQRPSEEVNADLIRFVDELRGDRRRRPLFVFAHYFDIHAPYGWWRNAPPLDEKDLPAVNRAYDEGVRRVDAAASQLWSELGRRGLTKENTILCLTADHGEQLGEHGIVANHADLYGETARVPLIVAGPGIAQASIDVPVSTLDVATTLLREAGTAFTKPVDGRDLFAGSRSIGAWLLHSAPPARDRLVLGNPHYTRSISISDGRYRFILNLETVYKEVRLGKPAASAVQKRKSIHIRETAQTGSIALYMLPRGQYAAYTVTIEHTPRAAAGDCAELNYAVWLAPQVTYMNKPLAWRGPLRLRFSGARSDQATFVVYPARCAGEVTARLDRYDSASRQGETVVITDLWRSLFAERKQFTADELFDRQNDPGMRRNLIANPALSPVAERLRRSLHAQFESVVASTPRVDPTRRYSKEELQKLRSLGYIQ